jgi:hypothetical protein
MTDARIGWGGKVYLGTSALESTLTLSERVVDTTFPQDEADEVEVTHLLRPASARSTSLA